MRRHLLGVLDVGDAGTVGLALWRGRLVYAWRGGWLRWWPMWPKGLLVAAWNRTACTLTRRHEVYLYPTDSPTPGLQVCVHCCKEWR